MKSSIFNLKYPLAALPLCALALNARAQSGPPYYVDLSSLNTNVVDNYHWATVSNTAYGFTNAPMHIHDTNIVTGEFVLNAFQKENSNMVWEVAQNTTNYNLIQSLNTFIFDYAVTNGGSGYSFTGDTLSNSLYMNGTLTNCALTNSTYAGNGFYLTDVSSNSFDANTLSWLQSISGGGGSFPDITDIAGMVGINQTSPSYLLDLGYPATIGDSAAGNGNTIQIDDSSGGMHLNASAGLTLGSASVSVDAYGDLSADSSVNVNANAFMIVGDYSGEGDAVDICDDGSARFAYGASTIDTGGNLVIATLYSDGGNFTSDGYGNVTAQTFIPLSDRTLKENIVTLPAATALSMASSLTNYEWNFKARTNLVSRLMRHRIPTFITNAATQNVRTNWTYNMTTNTAAKVIPASGRQFGPMAQDWHAATGLDDGHHISVTAMQGLLLGSVQELNRKQSATTAQGTNTGDIYLRLPEVTISHSTNSTFGNGAGLIAADGNYLYISTGTNTWRRISLPANGW